MMRPNRIDLRSLALQIVVISFLCLAVGSWIWFLSAEDSPIDQSSAKPIAIEVAAGNTRAANESSQLTLDDDKPIGAASSQTGRSELGLYTMHIVVDCDSSYFSRQNVRESILTYPKLRISFVSQKDEGKRTKVALEVHFEKDDIGFHTSMKFGLFHWPLHQNDRDIEQFLEVSLPRMKEVSLVVDPMKKAVRPSISPRPRIFVVWSYHDIEGSIRGHGSVPYLFVSRGESVFVPSGTVLFSLIDHAEKDIDKKFFWKRAIDCSLGNPIKVPSIEY